MDDVEPYRSVRSVRTVDGSVHLIEASNGAQWCVAPAIVQHALDPDAAEQYARGLRDAARRARQLNEIERRRQVHPVNAAISDEVREFMAVRDWRPSDAAAAFGMATPTLFAKLECRQPWSLTDLAAIAAAVNPSNPAEIVLFLYGAATGVDVTESLDEVLEVA